MLDGTMNTRHIILFYCNVTCAGRVVICGTNLLSGLVDLSSLLVEPMELLGNLHPVLHRIVHLAK